MKSERYDGTSVVHKLTATHYTAVAPWSAAEEPDLSSLLCSLKGRGRKRHWNSNDCSIEWSVYLRKWCWVCLDNETMIQDFEQQRWCNTTTSQTTLFAVASLDLLQWISASVNGERELNHGPSHLKYCHQYYVCTCCIVYFWIAAYGK